MRTIYLKYINERDLLQQDLLENSRKSMRQLSIFQKGVFKKLKSSIEETILSKDNNSNRLNRSSYTLYKSSKHFKNNLSVILIIFQE